MRDELGSRPSDILVGLGPSIGPCCYEVGREVIEGWDALGVDPERQAVIERSPRPYLDLWTANELALAAVGVPWTNVERAGICTRCHSQHFFSRRAGVGHRGLFGAIIALSDGERVG
jgi:copper oxidase (laccase) domain-containing protein